MRRRASLAVLLVLAATAVTLAQHPAGAPPMVNARLEARPGGDLAAVIRAQPSGAADVTWVGYSVPSAGRDQRCCWTSSGGAGTCCGGCRLERGGPMPRPAADAALPPQRPVPLEPGADTVAVLVRVAGGAVDRIRTFSADCPLDAGGRVVVWLPDVTPDSSASWLQAQMTTDRRLDDDVLMALAAHAAPRALDVLLAEARNGDTAHGRGQTLFWLAQRAGDRAIGAIRAAIDEDPDTEVKRKAVFALSLLPAAEGVPLLIEVARAHSNLAVRKQAFFWLGQSNDRRALAFFADVLKR